MVSPVASLPPHLAYAMEAAGNRNGVDFDYLVQTAIRESSLNPEARAQSSSATGLFQFIESTWLEVMKTEGPALGYGQYAAHIERQGDSFVVRDPQVRQAILDLRMDPQVSSDLAAAFTRRNGDYLLGRFGRMPSAGELYIAHFLGPSGAERFFEAGLSQPDAAAAPLFPQAASANPSIFYADGRARTVREVYEVLVARHANGGGANASFAAQQLAGGQMPGTAALPSRFEMETPLPQGVSFTEMFSTQVGGSAGNSPVAGLADDEPAGPLFAGFYGNR